MPRLKFHRINLKQGDARGVSEVRHGTSSIHFHCLAPGSCIGPRIVLFARLQRLIGELLLIFTGKSFGKFGGSFVFLFFLFFRLTKSRAEVLEGPAEAPIADPIGPLLQGGKMVRKLSPATCGHLGPSGLKSKRFRKCPGIQKQSRIKTTDKWSIFGSFSTPFWTPLGHWGPRASENLFSDSSFAL